MTTKDGTTQRGMLVLTRRIDEEIIVGDPADPIVRIRICDLENCSPKARVRVGIIAARNIPIARAETIKG